MFAYVGPAESREDALARLAEYHPYIAIDTETISLVDRTCIGVGVATSPTEAYYFPLGNGRGWPNVPEEDTRPLISKLSQLKTVKLFFNSIFDLDRIEDSLGIVAEPFQDVAIATQVQGLPNDLASLCGHLLGEDHQTIQDILPARKTMLDVEYEKTAWKCISDCLATYRLFELMRLEEWSSGNLTWTDWIGHSYDVTAKAIDCYQIDLALIPLLRRMSKRGIKLRPDRIDYWYKRLSEEMFRYEDYFNSIGIQPGSNQQVGMALAKRGNWMPLTKSRRQLQVNEDMLLSLGDPVGLMVLAWRKRRTLRNTFIVPWRGSERAYTHYRLDLATGRLASSNKNVQNIPGANYQGLKPQGDYNIRDIFEADSGVWTWLDLDQAEMRAFAYLTQDPVMLNAYKEGLNLHEITEARLWPGKTKANADYYTLAKTANFAIIFMISAVNLSRQTLRPVQESQRMISDWFQLYSVAKDRIDEWCKEITPWSETLFGRRCRLPIDQVGVTETHITKCRVSYRVQGTVADIIKRIMLLVDSLGIPFPLQVHDELVCDGDYEFPEILSHIHPELTIPFELHKGSVWT